jgi:arylsulfatase A-like enzyme
MDFQRAVRQGDWKLIRYPQVDVTQLFNLRDDPAEIHNVCDAHPEKVRELWKLLEERQKMNGDSLPLTVKTPKERAITPQQLRDQGRQVQTGPNARTTAQR